MIVDGDALTDVLKLRIKVMKGILENDADLLKYPDNYKGQLVAYQIVLEELKLYEVKDD